MNNLSPLQNMLAQLNEFYQLILANQSKKIVVTPEIKEAVEYLAKQVELLTQVTEEEMKRLGVTKEALNKTIYGPKDQLPLELRNLLNKSQELKCQLEGCQTVVNKIIKKQKEEEKLKKGQGAKRKDKFKNVGGKKGWIPL